MSDPINIQRDAEFPRQFVPKNADCGQWEIIEPLLRQLLEWEIGSDSDLEQWLLDQSELDACIGEESSRRYIAMTCDTDDKEREQRYMYFVETVQPKSKPYYNNLRQKYLDCAFRKELDKDRYFVYDRSTQNESDLYREENIPLQTEEAKLKQKYQKICGAMTVEYQGKELAMPQLRPFLEKTDRQVREEVWKLEAERRMKDRDELDGLFNELVKLRTQIARNAGYANFLEYAFPMKERFDYTPADCRDYHNAIAEHVVPLYKDLLENRRGQLGLDTLRPWDTAVDPLGRDPLTPFEAGKELAAGCLIVFRMIDPSLGEQFADFSGKGLIDLESRKGKAPGGYQSTLSEARMPFIFMNAAGTDQDVYTLLHEGGHAFHSLAARQEPLVEYRHAPLEFCEVASMSMELLAEGKLSPFYSEADEARSFRGHLENVLRLLPWVALIDSFQHWIYLNPDHSTQDRRDAWLEHEARYMPGLDWSGFEDWKTSYWQRQLHIYQVPFYYIEYGIAELGALGVWRNYADKGGKAIEDLRNAFALGGSRPLPELFQTAGLKFDFSAKTIAPLAEKIMQTLEALPQ